MYVLITNNECSAAVETIRRADGKTTVMLSFLEPAIRKEAVVIHSALISNPELGERKLEPLRLQPHVG